MNPQTRVIKAQPDAEQVRLQEEFGEQIEDASLPAEQVLAKQQETRENDGNTPLFVP